MSESKSTTMELKGQQSFTLNQREHVLSTEQQYPIIPNNCWRSEHHTYSLDQGWETKNLNGSFLVQCCQEAYTSLGELTMADLSINWCFQIVVLKKTLESSLGCKKIKSVNCKGNQSWIFIGRTDAEALAPVLWLPDMKSQLTGKDPDAGKDWGQKKRGAAENEMVS